MNSMNISKNILKQRKKHSHTQQDLADFLNISKAAVSKWEKSHSVPDIQYIGEMAVLFDITIDELVGFSPQLNREEIRNIYYQLSHAFTIEDYDTVINKVRDYGKHYYSCYPLLTSLTGLLINHFKLAEDTEYTFRLAEMFIARVLENSDSVSLRSQVTLHQSIILITKQQPEKVKHLLAEYTQPRLPFNALLAQTHLMTGKESQAKMVLQAEIYESLVFIMDHLTALLYSDLYNDLDHHIQRGTELGKVFNLKQLHPNSMLNFYIVAAMKTNQDKDRCLFYLGEFLESVKHLSGDYYLHGDSFFNHIDEWLKSLDLGADVPVSLLTAKDQLLDAVINNENFERYKNDITFKNIVHSLKRTLEGE